MVTVPAFQQQFGLSHGPITSGSHSPCPVVQSIQGSMCTMHQMGEVNFYFRQVRPYIREITNAPTVRHSSSVAARVASDLASNWAPHDMFYAYLRLTCCAFGAGVWKAYGFYWFSQVQPVTSVACLSLLTRSLNIFFWCIWQLVLGFFWGSKITDY